MPRAKKNKVEIEKPPPKKRGRKPKGGKIITEIKPNSDNNIKIIENIILHLKCNKGDLNKIYDDKINSYDFHNNENIFVLNKNNNNNNSSDDDSNEDKYCDSNIVNNKIVRKETVEKKIISSKKAVWEKLRKLSFYLNTNDVSDKRSACFWCTCDFDNPLIYIPKYELNGCYQCYGCFCSPECATSHLFNEQIDSSIKFERYSLLNYLYCKVYDYKKNIKPAPNPYYTLSKYQGNLSISEYRSLFNTERFIIIVDKPLARNLPELHEDNDDFLFNNNDSNMLFINNNVTQQSKNDILTTNFNL